LKMPQAIFFDLWNTLLYCPTRERVARIIRVLGLEGKADYRRVIEEMDETVFIDADYTLKEMFMGLCMEHGVECHEDAAGEAAKVWEGRLDEAGYFADTEAGLDMLGGYKLAIVSNTDVSGAEYVRRKQVDERFDLVVMSCYVGCAKPDPRIYRIAADELGVKPGECWMVGDSLQCDVKGAEKAGLNAILLDRDGGKGGRGHVKVKSLEEVLSKVR